MKYTEAERSDIKARLIRAANEDAAIVAAAVFGSAARGEEDAWSDIDLGFRVCAGQDITAVCNRWTDFMGQTFPVASTLDIRAQGALYRVFLLDSTLQIDLSFWPHDRFTLIGPHHRLLFGEASLVQAPPADMGQAVGMGWLYLLHARSYISRGRGWQAQLMLEALRNQIFMLRCHRHGLAYDKGRGIDRLPEGEADAVGGCMPGNRSTAKLARAFVGLSAVYMQEVEAFCAETAGRLAAPVGHMRDEIAVLGSPPDA